MAEAGYTQSMHCFKYFGELSLADIKLKMVFFLVSSLALSRCATVDSEMPIKITLFLEVQQNKIISLAEHLLQQHLRKKSQSL